MGFRDMFAREPKRFVTEESFHRNSANQRAANAETLKALANEAGISPDRELRLEYFFYTDAPAKAAGLAADLGELGYEVEYRPSAADKRQVVVTGWTTPMVMSESVIDAWSQKMVELGFARDCDFDGWGTTPDQ